MSTNSTITVRAKNGLYHTIYCHWDGYPSHNGAILQEHYNTEEKVLALVALGDISSLAPSIEKPEGHEFMAPVRGYTVFYGRDRGEEDTEAIINVDYVAHDEQEFNYLFDDGTWTVNGLDLTQVLADN